MRAAFYLMHLGGVLALLAPTPEVWSGVSDPLRARLRTQA